MNTTPSEFRFRGWSMYPWIRNGDRLVAEHLPFDRLEVGDVVLAKAPDMPVPFAHRLIRWPNGKGGRRAILKGDNVERIDAMPLTGANYAGRIRLLLRSGKRIDLDRPRHRIWARILARMSEANLTPGIIIRRLSETCRQAWWKSPPSHRLEKRFLGRIRYYRFERRPGHISVVARRKHRMVGRIVFRPGTRSLGSASIRWPFRLAIRPKALTIEARKQVFPTAGRNPDP